MSLGGDVKFCGGAIGSVRFWGGAAVVLRGVAGGGVKTCGASGRGAAVSAGGVIGAGVAVVMDCGGRRRIGSALSAVAVGSLGIAFGVTGSLTSRLSSGWLVVTGGGVTAGALASGGKESNSGFVGGDKGAGGADAVVASCAGVAFSVVGLTAGPGVA